MSKEITPNQLQEFRKTGLLVIEDVFSPEHVALTRDTFHEHLAYLGIDHDAILAGKETDTGPRIKSPVSRIFYPKWKFLDIHLHPNLTMLAKDLLLKTYGSGEDPDFIHPYGKFSDIRAYVDRICWRLPDCIRSEGGLGLHLDRDPVDPYHLKSGGLKKWRPIQSLVCLTDHFHADSGGLRVVPGFHKRIDNYFKGKESEGGGDFHRMNSVKHEALGKQVRPVIAPAGSVIFWDNRLPHATSDRLSGCDTREVIYTGFLPYTEINKSYIDKQLDMIIKNQVPPAYAEVGKKETADRDWNVKRITDEQKSLIGLNDQKKNYNRKE